MNNNHRQRVVITGLGALSPIGLDVPSNWESLVNGRSGTHFEQIALDQGFTCQVAARVKHFKPEEYLPAREARRMPRFAQFAVAGAVQAVRDAQLDLQQVDRERVGVLIGTAFGGAMDESQDAAKTLFERGPMKVSPFYMVRLLPNMAAHHISCYFDTRGYTNTVAVACASGTQAIGEAVEVIRRGKAEVMLAGGAESQMSPLALASMNVIGGFSTRNDRPASASRPFEKSRDGIVGGEGAGVVVLETLEHALRRGARIYAEVLGYATSSDTSHVSHPDPSGQAAARVMQWALDDAGVTADQIDYISAHATATVQGDVAETRAIKLAFGERAYDIPINAAKSMTGHMSGGSGAFETVICCKTIETGVLHPTINYEDPDPECDLNYVPNVARQAQVRYALNNSFGFGGQNACLVLGAPS
ncbi:3-oxoacyl-[acyl-carrier-protein] synthase II [Thermoflexales bacterium]|nr:3-oxoacyl-[acyl-carrier-protein] synthase II [Thermoflexales bacterium]